MAHASRCSSQHWPSSLRANGAGFQQRKLVILQVWKEQYRSQDAITASRVLESRSLRVESAAMLTGAVNGHGLQKAICKTSPQADGVGEQQVRSGAAEQAGRLADQPVHHSLQRLGALSQELRGALATGLHHSFTAMSAAAQLLQHGRSIT